MTNPINLRAISLNIVDDVFINESFSHIAINNTLKQYQFLDKQDRAFITKLANGTIEKAIELDYIINLFSNLATEKMKPAILNILRLTVYQLKYMSKIPESAAINEAGKLVEIRKYSGLKSFVNGVLRNVARNIESIEYPNEQKKPVDYLSITYSIPKWIIERYRKDYDYNTVKIMCEAFSKEKPITIRCNLNKITTNDLINALQEQGAVVEPGNYLPYAIKLLKYDYIDGLSSFQQGLFQVQDESSMLIAEVANVKKGDLVIDLCAAPGGKTSHIAEKLEGTGTVISRDISDTKVNLIKDTVNRLGLKNVQVEKADALELDETLINTADVVIADVPCSGLGIIGKKADIKYKTSNEQIRELLELQKEILKIAVQYLKKGGILVYSTCTINSKENQDNVKWCINNLGMKVESISKYLPQELQTDEDKGYIQLIPGIHATDGLFVARLKKDE
ncbi:MAG: rRNA ((967)-C(5))-methyltransferase RsmB [Clostridiales bacterium]|nr:rRNA ((967)-C(5))-methyltransferase RsmB [Clostridiales bacterium]